MFRRSIKLLDPAWMKFFVEENRFDYTHYRSFKEISDYNRFFYALKVNFI